MSRAHHRCIQDSSAISSSQDDMKSYWGNHVYNVVVKKRNWSTNSNAINSVADGYTVYQGKTCWTLAKEENMYFMQCKLCALFIKNKDTIESVDSDDKFKKRYYAKWQFIRGEDIENKEYFKKKMKSLKKHETKNKRHVAVATIMLEESGDMGCKYIDKNTNWL
eukprot:331979_1